MLSIKTLRQSIPTPFSRGASATVHRSSDSQVVGDEAVSEQTERDQLANHVAAIRCPDATAAVLLAALAEVRKAVSARLSPPIQAIVDLGGVDALLQRLGDGCGCSAAAQFEAAWAVTNIAAGTAQQTMCLVNAGAVEKLFQTILSDAARQRSELCDQCMWALGNIAGEGVDLRDRLLKAGIMGTLGQVYEQLPALPWDLQARTQVLRSLTWLMSSLCKGSPAPALEEVDCAFDYFAQVLQGTEDSQMLGDALWGISYLLEGAAACDEEGQLARGNRFLAAGFPADEVPLPPKQHPIVARIGQCARLDCSRSPAPVPALRILGHLVSLSAPHFTDVALEAGALQAFRGALEEYRMPTSVRRDAATALGNIAAGTPMQAQQLLRSTGGRKVWDVLVRELPDAPAEVRLEAARIVANLAKGPSSVVAQLHDQQALTLLAVALRSQPDAALQRILLDGTVGILSYVADHATMKKTVLHACEKTGLQEVLEELKDSDKKARILGECWF